MTSKSPRKKIEPSYYQGFRDVAENFYEGAKIAFDYTYFNAAGVLFVHSAIAYSDAISIRIKGIKIQGENHYEIISLLNELIPQSEEKKKALNHLQYIIDQKTNYHTRETFIIKKTLNLFGNILRDLKHGLIGF